MHHITDSLLDMNLSKTNDRLLNKRSTFVVSWFVCGFYLKFLLFSILIINLIVLTSNFLLHLSDPLLLIYYHCHIIISWFSSCDLRHRHDRTHVKCLVLCRLTYKYYILLKTTGQGLPIKPHIGLILVGYLTPHS